MRTLGIIALSVALLIGGGAHASDAETQADRCNAKLSALVEDLDGALVSIPRATTVRFLMLKHLPVEGCDIEKAIEVVKRSRFFSHVSDTRTYVVIAFSSKGFEGYSGLDIQFSLVKASGASQHPFVIVHIGD